MMKCHELMGFMTPALASEILNYAYETDKTAYRATLAAVADARKLRPVFYERKPRVERHREMLEMLSRPRLEPAAAELIRNWLVKTQVQMLSDFMDALGISHKEGVVETFPDEIDSDKLKAAVDLLLGKYPQEKVVVYLHGFSALNAASWKNLDEMLQTEERLQLA
jgi:hypothetical protein